jgi:SHOCT-like domain
MMNEQSKQILQMLAEGKITAEEAARLLDALEQTEVRARESSSLLHEPNRRRVKYLRVLVDARGVNGEGPSKVNIRVPLQLLRAGVQIAGLMPPQALGRANEAMARSGVPMDLTQLKPQHLDDLIEALDEMTVEVDDPDAQVRIFCE